MLAQTKLLGAPGQVSSLTSGVDGLSRVQLAVQIRAPEKSLAQR